MITLMDETNTIINHGSADPMFLHSDNYWKQLNIYKNMILCGQNLAFGERC